ncbi:MAG: hypothetical protein AAB683_01015, partial [Patescibacteria group bacterium]
MKKYNKHIFLSVIVFTVYFFSATGAFAASRYWVGGCSTANWSCSDAGPVTNWGSASNTRDNVSVPGSTDDVFFDGVGNGASNSTLSASQSINSLDMTGYANTLTHSAAVNLTVAGNGVTFKIAGTYTPSNITTSALIFTGTSGTTTITTSGQSTGNITFNGSGGKWQLQDNLATRNIVLTFGKFDANNKDVTAASFSSSNSNARHIQMGSGTWTLTTNGTIWLTTTVTGLTLVPDTSTISLTHTSAKTFSGGGKTYYNLTSGAGDLTIAGSNTFDNNLTVNNAGATNGLLITSGTTQTINGTFSMNGSAGTLAKLAATPSGIATLSKSSGTVSEDYMSIASSTVTGGASWYAGANSTDVGNNTGWTFSAAPTAPTVTTNAPSSVSTTTLTLSGSITATGGADATQSGFAYGTVSTLATVISTSTLGAQSGTATFTSDISSLTANTVYYFRAYATNSAGTSYGAIESTTTLAVSAPTVTTQAASSVDTTSVTGNGNITATGYINPTVRGFVRGTTTAYGATTTENGNFSTGAFTGSITSLTCNTLYHYAAYATNSQGTSYGSDTTFTTASCGESAPTVTTNAPSSVSTTTLT